MTRNSRTHNSRTWRGLTQVVGSAALMACLAGSLSVRTAGAATGGAGLGGSLGSGRYGHIAAALAHEYMGMRPMFNPQPDPPGRGQGQGVQPLFNPQPDPPGRGQEQGVQPMFNPQPDPPGRGQGQGIQPMFAGHVVQRPAQTLSAPLSAGALPAGLRAALAHLHLGRGAAESAPRNSGWTLGARGLRGPRSFAARPSCNCGGGGGGGSSWGQQAELTASNGAPHDAYGYTVALSGNGNVALVGAIDANNKAGTAYIFERFGSSWSQLQELTASDGVSGDMFGRSVAVNSTGSTLLVGAPAKNSGQGVVYVFVAASYFGWFQQAELSASDGSAFNYFGVSAGLSGDGNTALIGAYGKNGSTGAAYTFTRSGSTWGQQTKLTAPDGVTNDEYGWSVALSSDGSTALIGAPYKYTYHGAAYVYGHGSSGWSQQAELTASDGTSYDQFGSSVALNSNGTTALIGAPYKNYDSGAAYVFMPFFGWYQMAELSASDGGFFGLSVALNSNGTTALVGGPTGHGDTGAAYVFQGSWSNWAQAAELLASDGAMYDNAGTSVALSGDGSTALVGAYGHNNLTGAAYVF